MLEKVLRLMNLLNAFKKHRVLRDRFVLKGGTALNAFLFDLPRLSADIDLNYVGETDAERMKEERPELERAIEAVCQRENLQVQAKPSEYLGGKWHLRYESALGGSSKLEIDISFGYRTPLFPVPTRSSFVLGRFRAKISRCSTYTNWRPENRCAANVAVEDDERSEASGWIRAPRTFQWGITAR